MQNHFELFGLTPQFDINLSQLDQAYREVQNQVHPDKFVNASSAEQRVAMQWATRANEAYQTLKHPLKRASYLCELAGVDIGAENNTAMPIAFLMQQMTWREQLDDAQDNPTKIDQLEQEITTERREQYRQLQRYFLEANMSQAALCVRQLMFIEKFADAVDNALSP